MITLNFAPPRSLTAASFESAVGRWCDSKVKAGDWVPRVERRMRRFARHWSRILGRLPVSEIRPFDALRLYEYRNDGHLAASSINLERAHFRSFWRWLHRMEITKNDPVHGWPRARGPRRRQRIAYSWRQVQRIASELHPLLARFVLFATLSGLRAISEILALHWGWILKDGSRSVLLIPGFARKQREELRLVLSRRAVRVLGRPGEPAEKVFRLPCETTIRRRIREAVGRAGLPWAGLHSFRRTFATLLLNSGVPEGAVQEMGGWKSLEVLRESYYILPDFKAEEFMGRITKPRRGKGD